ncbi:MAG: RNA-binding S4 domain-containing protein [Blastocatellia bacterium]|nr:RNA-binding S4 domain-containing protein [Blastocatellia bacterium]
MRLDLFLKVSRLIVRRTVAQEVCEAGAVKVNGATAKPAREVRVGDTVAIRQRGRVKTIRVAVVPESKTIRCAPTDLYELVSEETTGSEPFPT